MTKSNKKSIPVKALSTAALLGTISVVGATHHADAATGEKPTIQAPDQQVKYGTTWNPYQNVTAHDKEDGDLTNEVYYEAPYFETTNPGDYNVLYGVYDLDDNETTVNRNVRVLKEGVEPVNPKPTPPQPEQPNETPKDPIPEQPSDNEKPSTEKPANNNEEKPNTDKPSETNPNNTEQPSESTPEQPSNNNPSDVEKPNNTNPSDKPTGNEEQPNETPNNTTPDKPSETNPSNTEQPSESTPEQPSDNNPSDVEKPDNTNPSDEPTNSGSPSETSKEKPSENVKTPNETTENKPSNTTSKQFDTNVPSNVDAPKLTESPKATTVHNQPGSTQPVSSYTTSKQPNVEKEFNNNPQRLTESPKVTTVNNTLGSTQIEPTPVSTNVTTNNTSDVISPENVETKHDLDHSGVHDNTPVHTKTTISDNYTTNQPTMNPSDEDFVKSTIDSKEDVRNNNNSDETLPETGGADSSREAGVIVSLFAGLLAFVGLRRKKENN